MVFYMYIALICCPLGCYFVLIDPPPQIGGVPLPVPIIGSLIQPGMGAMYEYYYKYPPRKL